MLQGIGYEINAVVQQAVDMGLAISLCSIYQPTGTVEAGGGPDGTMAPVAGMQNIPCMFAPMATGRIQATDVRAIEEITSYRLQHVWLTQHLPAIRSGSSNGWMAYIDSEWWTILGAEDDSQAQMTRLSVRIAQM